METQRGTHGSRVESRDCKIKGSFADVKECFLRRLLPFQFSDPTYEGKLFISISCFTFVFLRSMISGEEEAEKVSDGLGIKSLDRSVVRVSVLGRK